MTESTVSSADDFTADRQADHVRVFLDDETTPVAEYSLPARLELDTTHLEDGTHRLRIEARGADGTIGVRTISFDVRNGPSIEVDGLDEGDVVGGDISVMVHAWGGASAEDWEPSRSESPAPAPTWAWVLLIAILAWALYYGVQHWTPPAQFLDTPTYPIVDSRD